jgi:hypothetical protein
VNNANFVPFKNGKCLNEQLQNEKGAKIQLPSSNYEEYLKLVETDDIFRFGELNPNISPNYLWKLFRPLALPLVGVPPPTQTPGCN